MATVTVSLIAPDGQRHAVTVEAKSLYTAIFEYNYLAPIRPGDCRARGASGTQM